MSDPKEVADLVGKMLKLGEWLDLDFGRDDPPAGDDCRTVAATLQSLSADLERVTKERDEAQKAERDWIRCSNELTGHLESAEARISTLTEALEFYAHADTYAAIGFMADRPAGEFMDDFSFDEDFGRDMPGKRARAALRPHKQGEGV